MVVGLSFFGFDFAIDIVVSSIERERERGECEDNL